MPDDVTNDADAAAAADAPNLEKAAASPAKPQTLEDLLADFDPDGRKVILDQVSKARSEAKSLRDRLKALEPKASEYDRLEQASKTDMERLQEQLQGANQRTAAAFARAARAEVKAALAGVVDDPDAIVDDLNLAKFVTDDGEVDTGAIGNLRSKYAKFSSPRQPRPDASQASSGNGKSTPSSPAEEFASLLRSSTRR